MARTGGQRVKKLLLIVAAAVMALVLPSLPAQASTTGASSTAPSDVTGTVSSPQTAAVTCSRFAGHYCARVTFTSVSGGIRVTRTASTGYTTGAGRGREWFRYSCNAGTCYVLPSATFFYNSRNVQL